MRHRDLLRSAAMADGVALALDWLEAHADGVATSAAYAYSTGRTSEGDALQRRVNNLLCAAAAAREDLLAGFVPPDGVPGAGRAPLDPDVPAFLRRQAGC